jgi:transposase
MDFYSALTRLSVPEPVSNWVQASVDEMARQAAQATQEITQKLTQQLERSEQQLAQSTQQLANAEQHIALLTAQLAQLRRMQFGPRSEAFDAAQLSLFEQDLQADLAQAQATVEQAAANIQAQTQTPSAPARRSNHPGRQTLPPHLPRVEVRHEPARLDCEACAKPLHLIGEDITEQLEVEPAKFWVNRHIRPQYACRCCETVLAQPVPAAVIDASLAGTSVLAWVLTQKYLDHLPLYRIEQIAARQGVELARSTLSGWVGRVGFALQPLVDRLIERQRAQTVLHADETPVQQLDPGKGKTKRAYLWVYRSCDTSALRHNASADNEIPNDPIVVFDYQSGRGGCHASAFLKGWQGELMVDDYSGYKALFASGTDSAGITELACWAHVRRKFFDLQASGPHPQAEQALQSIQVLYDIERQAKTMSIDERAALRQTQAQPQLQAFLEWLTQTRHTAAAKSGLARAIDYTLKRWQALKRYAENGERPIDNNPAENAIRPIAIGRKNWLFAGSEQAGQRAAAIQSLLATAKLNGLDPAAWLKDTLDKLPTWPNSRIDELLPLRSNTSS